MLFFASLLCTIRPLTPTMSLLEILKTGVGGQEASRRIFDNFRPIIYFDAAKTQLATVL
jgi:hypothetical protein